MPLPSIVNSLHSLWSIFVTLGGIAFLKQIADWVRARPNLTGGVEGLTMGQTTLPDGRNGVMMLLGLYIVNSRTAPTTVRGWAERRMEGRSISHRGGP